MIQFKEKLLHAALASIREYLDTFEKKTGCFFLVLDGAARIAGTREDVAVTEGTGFGFAPPESPELPTIVDVVDCRCGYYGELHT